MSKKYQELIKLNRLTWQVLVCRVEIAGQKILIRG